MRGSGWVGIFLARVLSPERRLLCGHRTYDGMSEGLILTVPGRVTYRAQDSLERSECRIQLLGKEGQTSPGWRIDLKVRLALVWTVQMTQERYPPVSGDLKSGMPAEVEIPVKGESLGLCSLLCIDDLS